MLRPRTGALRLVKLAPMGSRGKRDLRLLSAPGAPPFSERSFQETSPADTGCSIQKQLSK